MPVEIRKLIIKGVVKNTSSPSRSSTNFGPVGKPSTREQERETMKYRKLKREILRECKEMVNIIIERKSNRF